MVFFLSKENFTLIPCREGGKVFTPSQLRLAGGFGLLIQNTVSGDYKILHGNEVVIILQSGERTMEVDNVTFIKIQNGLVKSPRPGFEVKNQVLPEPVKGMLEVLRRLEPFD